MELSICSTKRWLLVHPDCFQSERSTKGVPAKGAGCQRRPCKTRSSSKCKGNERGETTNALLLTLGNCSLATSQELRRVRWAKRVAVSAYSAALANSEFAKYCRDARWADWASRIDSQPASDAGNWRETKVIWAKVINCVAVSMRLSIRLGPKRVKAVCR